MCRYRTMTIAIHRVRYHHGPDCTTEAPPSGRVSTPEDERFRRELTDAILNSEPQEVSLRAFIAEQFGPEQPTLQELVMGQNGAATESDGTAGEPRAIEGGRKHVSAEDYLRSFQVEPQPNKRKD